MEDSRSHKLAAKRHRRRKKNAEAQRPQRPAERQAKGTAGSGTARRCGGLKSDESDGIGRIKTADEGNGRERKMLKC